MAAMIKCFVLSAIMTNEISMCGLKQLAFFLSVFLLGCKESEPVTNATILHSRNINPDVILGIKEVPFGNLIEVDFSEILIEDKLKAPSKLIGKIVAINNAPVEPPVKITITITHYSGIKADDLIQKEYFTAIGYETGNFIGLPKDVVQMMVEESGAFSYNTGEFRWEREFVLLDIK